MRVRHRLMVAMVSAYLALTATAGAVAWMWLESSLRQQAVESARAIGRVLADGGFSRNAAVQERIRTLTGHSFSVLEANATPPPGTVSVNAVEGGVPILIAVDYRTHQHRRAQTQILLAVIGAGVIGSLVFLVVAWQISARFARPVELLAEEAHRLGEGQWERPVVARGEGEVARLTQALDDMRRRLVALDQQRRSGERLAAIGTYAATIAHEVRNPLAAVRLSAQMLAAERATDPAIALILDETERLDLIVDELLGVAKGLTIQLAPVELRPLAEDVVRLLARQAQHVGVQVTIDGAARVRADARRLRQVLMNLVLNAIQACQRGDGSEVVITLHRDGFAVSDNGPGVPDEQQAHIFTAFASGRADGTGLGLHLAMAVATAHNATLTYATASPRGARFILSGLVPEPAA